MGYYLKFHIDTVLAAYPENAQERPNKRAPFYVRGNEAAIPIILEMETGQRYLIRGWEDPDQEFFPWNSPYNSGFRSYRWMINSYGISLADGASVDFSDPEMAAIKNKIDILNENLHTLEHLSPLRI